MTEAEQAKWREGRSEDEQARYAYIAGDDQLRVRDAFIELINRADGLREDGWKIQWGRDDRPRRYHYHKSAPNLPGNTGHFFSWIFSKKNYVLLSEIQRLRRGIFQ